MSKTKKNLIAAVLILIWAFPPIFGPLIVPALLVGFTPFYVFGAWGAFCGWALPSLFYKITKKKEW